MFLRLGSRVTISPGSTCKATFIWQFCVKYILFFKLKKLNLKYITLQKCLVVKNHVTNERVTEDTAIEGLLSYHKVESVAIVSVAEFKMSFTHSVLYVEVMKPSWYSWREIFKIRQLEFYDPNSLLHCIIWKVTNPFISKQGDRSIQMNNQNRWHSRELEWNEFWDFWSSIQITEIEQTE